MALKQVQHCISEQDYLQGELMADMRHEFIDGEVFAKAGASIRFDAIDLTVAVSDIYHRVNNEDMRDYLQQLAQQAG